MKSHYMFFIAEEPAQSEEDHANQDQVGAHPMHMLRESSERLQQAIAEHTNIKILFHRELALLGTECQRMAVVLGTEHAEQFGLRRDAEATHETPWTLIPLSRELSPFSKRLVQEFATKLTPARQSIRDYKYTDLKISDTNCLGRRYCCDFSVSRAPLTPFTPQECMQLHALYSKEPYDNTQTEVEFLAALIKNRSALEVIRRDSLNDYKRIKLLMCAEGVSELFREFHPSDWVLATPRLEINKLLFTMTQYFTWMSEEYQQDPITHMAHHSTVCLLHVDSFLIKSLLQECSRIFQRVIEWNGEDRQDLLNSVGLFVYVFAHTMPFKRGNATICEWFERMLYQHHGFSLRYTQPTKVHLDALTLPMNEFIEYYPALIEIVHNMQSDLHARPLTP